MVPLALLPLLLQKHRYGFLTYLQATFFIKRLARDTYAFTMAVPFSAKGPSVREMLACEL